MEMPNSSFSKPSLISTPDSIILATAGSREVGHEVILVGGPTTSTFKGDSYGFNDDLESSYELEEVQGRPGQASGLLAARHSRQTEPRISSSQMSLSPQQSSEDDHNTDNEEDDEKRRTTNASKTPAVPVTPDNRGASSSSLWASAFA